MNGDTTENVSQAETKTTKGILHMHYLSFNQGVEGQRGCQMLSLHVVLSQDRRTDFKNIIWPLNTHPDQYNQNKISSYLVIC